MRHGVRHARRVAGMCCAREVTAHERQMGHEQPSNQCGSATEHDLKLSVVDTVRQVSRVIGCKRACSAQASVARLATVLTSQEASPRGCYTHESQAQPIEIQARVVSPVGNYCHDCPCVGDVA